jgi:hypothetical protein
MENKLSLISFIILLSGITLFSTKSHAADEKPPLSEQLAQEEIKFLLLPRHKPLPNLFSSNESNTLKDARFNQLNNIINTIKLKKEEIEEKLILLKNAKTEQGKVSIQFEIDDINQSIKEQERSFEMIQTGGFELDEVEDSPEVPFDWQNELLEILKPILNELHQLTENKRELVDLQKKIPLLESQILDISEKLEFMAQINIEGLESDTLKQFEKIKRKWQKLLEEKKYLLELAHLQLNEMIKSQVEKEVSVSDHIKQFATGRGATLFFAVLAFFVVYFFLTLLRKGVLWINKRKHEGKQQTYFQRIFTLIYYTATIIFSLTATFYVLNIRNDQVLIGIAIILLISLIWVLKNSIPRYIKELNILLNAGSVREGESISYNGIPMKVTNLNFYTKLTNPVLPELTLQLPLSELSNYISRPCSKDEPWFPCQEGDFVMLSDGTYSMVQRITLENVMLSLPNGMMPQTYAISDFLAEKPKNYSRGFFVVSDFGIDYKYQQQCTTQIPKLLCAGIREGLQQEPYSEFLNDIWVFFAKANTSSLDYKIVTVFDGQAAVYYHSITRDLQRYAVDVCNQQQWEIPFTQLVVHNAQS